MVRLSHFRLSTAFVAIVVVFAVTSCVPGGAPPAPTTTTTTTPPPPKEFPARGCYDVIPNNGWVYLVDALEILGPLNRLENALLNNANCPPVPPGVSPDMAQQTLVQADTMTDAIAVCRTLEPGTGFALATNLFVVGGLPDVWLCSGGFGPGDCVTSNSQSVLSILYLGPIDTLDNARYYERLTDPDFQNCLHPLGTLTIVSVDPGDLADSQAEVKCQDLGLQTAVSLASELYVNGFVSPAGLYRCA